jgi:GAF domain-containing protein
MKNTFGKAIIPPNDEQRIQALHGYAILDTLPDGFFTNMAQIIARSFDAPIALISLVDRERVFFKANVGMPGVENVDRGVSLCSLAILDDKPTVFNDALTEPCLLANPLVAGDFGLRFYAGAPIITPDGFAIGTVCVVDKTPREFSASDQELLEQFADAAMDAIMRRKENVELGTRF